MNTIPPEVTEIVNGCKDSIISGWKKLEDLTKQKDFLALLEPTEKAVSVTILPRESGLSVLSEKGFSMEREKMFHEAATGHTMESTAIWIVLVFDNKPYVTKMVRQPMSHAGSA